MKLGKFLIKLLNMLSDNETRKRRKHYPPHGEFEETINIPYIEGSFNPQTSFDVYLANDNRNNICVIDIHGGAYIFGEHKDNWSFCYTFAKQGFDVVNVDYRPNDGTRSVKDLISDVVKCINYIGPKSVALFSEALKGAKTVVWNGPMGCFEFAPLSKGTYGVCDAVATVKANGGVSIIGGGDSVSAVKKSGKAGEMSHVSTGGGASLEFLEGKVLPGVACLDEK